MRVPSYFFVLLALLASCTQDAGNTPPTSTSVATAPTTSLNLEGYELTPLPGTNAQSAVKRNADGKVAAMGTIENGQRQGSWTTYAATGYAPIKIEHYLNGQLHGAYLEMDNMGRLIKSANYQFNQLHGPYAELRASIPQVTATYKAGKLHGTYRLHTLQNGKVNRSMEYQDGVLEGPMKWFNDAEELMQEKLYRKGEVVN